MLILIMLLYLMKNTSCFALYITCTISFLKVELRKNHLKVFDNIYVYLYHKQWPTYRKKKELFMSDLSNNYSVFPVHIFFKMQMKREGKMTINVLHPFLAVTSEQVMEL
jgi:hypothetical protein